MKEKNMQFSPRNMRQIGEINDYYKVYMEDYVFTFLQQLTNGDGEFSRVVLLVGERYVDAEKCVNVIYGAIEGKKLCLEENRMIFDKENQCYLEEVYNKNFAEYEILGWSVVEKSLNAVSCATMWKDMGGLFQKENKILLHFLKDEKYPVLYCNYHNQIKQLDGFSIFYENNESMRKYLVLWNQWNNDSALELEEEIAVRKFRQCMQEKQMQVRAIKNRTYMLVVSLVMMLFVVITGTLMLHNYRYLKSVENTLNQLVDTFDVEIQEIIMANNSQVEKEYIVPENGMGVIEEKDKSVETEIAKEVVIGEELAERENSVELGKELEAVEKEIYVYLVQSGDTLKKICNYYYGSDEKIQEICELNNIKNANYIVIGQKILLP